MYRSNCHASLRPCHDPRPPESDGERPRLARTGRFGRTSLVGVVWLAALGLAGCGWAGSETAAAIDDLRSQIEVRDARIAELEEQVLTLDDEVVLVRTEQLRDRNSTRLEALEGAVGTLEEQLQATATELTDEIEARETLAEELDEEIRGQLDVATAQLRGELEEVEQGLAAVQEGLEQVRGGLREVRGLIEDLEVRYETLRDRLDRISAR